MKNNLFTHLLLAGLLVGLAINVLRPDAPARAAAPATATSTAQSSCETGRSVQVSGTAVVYVTPDRVLLKLGVQSNAATATGARDENERQIQQVVRAIRGLGIEARDIATDYYIVFPLYDDYSSLVIKGYRVDNTVSITLREADLADDVLIAAFQAGANEVLDVQFYTSELRKYRDQARDLAMRAAGEKAEALASAGGARSGCLLNASENIWSYYSSPWGRGRDQMLWAQNVVQNVASEAPLLEDTALNPGQIAVQAQVQASYSIE
jgi:uncharacterized protein YggE